MVRDLDFPVRVEVCPTVREADGLAMSSRNVLLEPEARQRAPALHRALSMVAPLLAEGVPLGDAMGHARTYLAEHGVEPEYFSAVSTDSLEPVQAVDRETLVAIAARFGAVRLIDNVLLHPPERGE
jgi:pantoate--beta-alanine ligase